MTTLKITLLSLHVFLLILPSVFLFPPSSLPHLALALICHILSLVLFFIFLCLSCCSSLPLPLPFSLLLPLPCLPLSILFLPFLYFISSSSSSSSRLMETAREMIRESLPIKCLEAVILGMYPFLHAHKHTHTKHRAKRFCYLWVKSMRHIAIMS